MKFTRTHTHTRLHTDAQQSFGHRDSFPQTYCFHMSSFMGLMWKICASAYSASYYSCALPNVLQLILWNEVFLDCMQNAGNAGIKFLKPQWRAFLCHGIVWTSNPLVSNRSHEPRGCRTHLHTLIRSPNHSSRTPPLSHPALPVATADINHNGEVERGRVGEIGERGEPSVSIGPFIRGSGTLINTSPQRWEEVTEMNTAARPERLRPSCRDHW